MGKRNKIEGGEFSIAGGYVFYDRLKDDAWMTRFLGLDISAPALDILQQQKENYNAHKWEVVAQELMATGLAEQEKERRLLSVLGNNTYNQKEISFEEYPQYIEAINLLVGLKDKYKIYLKELKAQANDDDNRRAAGGFRYFESRLATAINQGIKESMQNLGINTLMSMTYEEIQNYVENSINQSIERAIEKVANSNPGYLKEKVKIWKEIGNGFKKLNETGKNLFIQEIIDRYNLNNISGEITDWLFKNFQKPRRKNDLFWGSGKAIKTAMNISERKGSGLDGFISEIIPSLLNTSIGKGTKIKSDEFKTDSVEFFNITADVDIDKILDQAAYLNPGSADNKELVSRMDKFTSEVLNKAKEIFVVYDSSKMYRLSGSFSSRGFGGASGNLENLGAAMKEFGGANTLNENVAHILYQTIPDAILDNERTDLIEQVKKEIISCITNAFFDDIQFQGPKSTNDNVIHMLTLDAVRIPLSFYCIALSKAISKAADDINSDALKQYIRVSITLPTEIMYKSKEETAAIEESFPKRIYTAWNNQRDEAISQSQFKIHFLKNFEQIIDGLISGKFELF